MSDAQIRIRPACSPANIRAASWATVASGLGYTANEDVSYTGTAGTYRWRVYSYSGSGSFTLSIT